MRSGLEVAGNGWTEVVAPEERREKGGCVKEEEERAKMKFGNFQNYP